MAPALVSLTSSATAMVPTSSLFLAKNSGVLPSAANCSARPAGTFTPSSSIRRTLPAAMTFCPSRAVTPRPGTAAKSSTMRATIPRASHSAIIASASGCSLERSSAVASLSSAFSLMAGDPSARVATTISVTAGLPRVTVPVLSSTTVPTLRRFSSASALLNRMPISAPLPVPTIMATGVARPNAHGQLDHQHGHGGGERLVYAAGQCHPRRKGHSRDHRTPRARTRRRLCRPCGR